MGGLGGSFNDDGIWLWDSPNQAVVSEEAVQPSAPPAAETDDPSLTDPQTDASLVDDGDGKTSPADPPPPASGDAFDPAEHTVDAVVDHAAAHPEQVPSIVAAERAGKNRSTLLAVLAA